MRRHTGATEADSPTPTGVATSSFTDGGGRDPVAAEGAVARFVTALARAVHAFHTYPSGSPARADVLEVARDALRPCLPDDESPLVLEVTNEGLMHGGKLLHGDRGPERSLGISLRKAYVSTLEFRRGTPIRELKQLCGQLAFPDRLVSREEELPEILEQRGVSSIRAHVIATHQTIEGGTVPPELLELVERNREKLAGGAPANVAEGGWIRIDPSVRLDRVTMEDLPLLLQDAPSLGMALHQMAGGSAETTSPAEAMLHHYGEITDLYARSDPTVAATLFRRLADTVRHLPAPIRERLLKDQVLPELVDGREGGSILRHFDDDEIADALAMLLDLGVGGMEMLTAGLARLELPESRRPGILAEVSRRVEGEAAGAPVGEEATIHEGADDVDRRLTVEGGLDADYASLHGFDLVVDGAVRGEIDRIVRAVEESDPVEDMLRSTLDILALSSDPSIIGSTVRRARGLFFNLESSGNAGRLASWLAAFARVASQRSEQDEEVARRIRAALDEYVTPEFIRRVSALPPEDGGEQPLVTIISELGATGVGALVDSLASEADIAARNRLLLALQPRAPMLAEHLTDYLSHPSWFVVRNVVALLGFAGPGWESPLGRMLEHPHERVVREAFLALARIGTRPASAHVARALRHETASVRRHAGESVWRFDPSLSRSVLHDALNDEDLARRDPELVRGLLDAAALRELDDLDPSLRHLRWHALFWWNPGRRSLGLRAWQLSRADR